MKLLLSRILYVIGDWISITTMRWGDGYGYPLYNKIMLWSVDLDTHGKVWKFVKNKKANK
jgi:hypothetical protein